MEPVASLETTGSILFRKLILMTNLEIYVKALATNNKMLAALGLTTVAASSCGNAPQKDADPRPNIVLILADDLGYSDLGCYGGEINTPNIDSLASNGIRYTQYYNTSRSCPSRASLLTGLTPHMAGVGHMVKERPYIGYKGSIASNTVTLAEALKESGYQTAMTGKWHVTNTTDPNGSKENWPMQRGFDHFYGTLGGHGSFFDPKTLCDGNTPVRAEGDYYYTEAITDHAKEYITQMSEQKAPFFLYVAYTAPHYPMHARKEYIDRYKGHYAAGWDSLRVRRYERMLEAGILPSGTKLSAKDQQCYDWQSEQHKLWQQNRMEVYAAMVEQMDHGVGEIVEELKRQGKLENTMIIFLSDNGASNEGHLYNTVERTGTAWKDGMIPDSTLDGRKVHPGDFPDQELGGPDTYGSYGPQWAHLSVTPFRRYKSWMHEGGICAPMVVSWPAKITDHGALRKGVYSIIDIMPTFLEVAQTNYPDSIRGQKTLPITGVSMMPSMTKDADYNTRTLYWEHEGNRAIRQGRWKLVSEYPGSWKTLRDYPNKGSWELYDLETDRTEENDLAAQYPERVAQMAAAWEDWAYNSQVENWKAIGGEKW